MLAMGCEIPGHQSASPLPRSAGCLQAEQHAENDTGHAIDHHAQHRSTNRIAVLRIDDVNVADSVIHFDDTQGSISLNRRFHGGASIGEFLADRGRKILGLHPRLPKARIDRASTRGFQVQCFGG